MIEKKSDTSEIKGSFHSTYQETLIPRLILAYFCSGYFCMQEVKHSTLPFSAGRINRLDKCYHQGTTCTYSASTCAPRFFAYVELRVKYRYVDFIIDLGKQKAHYIHAEKKLTRRNAIIKNTLIYTKAII